MGKYLWWVLVALSVLLAGECSGEGPPQRVETKPTPTVVASTPTTTPPPTGPVVRPEACISGYGTPHTPSNNLLSKLDYWLEVEVEESVENEARVWMTIKVTNITDEVVSVTTGGIPWYGFRITTPDCQLVWNWPTFILLPINYHRLPPGETMVERKDWYGLDKDNKPVSPGTYVVAAFASLSLSTFPDDLVVGAKQFTLTKRFLANAPEPTATPIPPTPVPFYDRNIKFGQCRDRTTWRRPPIDEEIWAVINENEHLFVPDPQGIAVPGNMSRFYGSEHTPHRGIIVYVRERWQSDNWNRVQDMPSCYAGVPVEIRAFKGARPHPISDHIDPETGKRPVTYDNTCKSLVYGKSAPFPPEERDINSELRGIELTGERIAWYVPPDLRITMRNTTDKGIVFDASEDSPNVYVYRPETCELVLTFKIPMRESRVPQVLQAYETIQWILEWPQPDPGRWDGDVRFLAYPTFTFIAGEKRWRWVGSGMQLPREYP